MGENCVTNAKYTYVHDPKCCGGIDSHHVLVRRSVVRAVFAYVFVALIFGNMLYSFLAKDNSVTLLFWSFLVSAFLIKLLLLKPIKKESVIIMPSFGVQLETHYMSGKVSRRFVPVGKILKPILQECVTPVTCYWNLSLMVLEEEELMLVFQELQPPLKMLVPIWKALCSAMEKEVDPEIVANDND